MKPSLVQTAEDLLNFREPGKTAELVRGALIVREPPSTSHVARCWCTLVWVIDPLHRHASIYRADGSISIVGPAEDLQGEEIIPGFRCPLREIL